MLTDQEIDIRAQNIRRLIKAQSNRLDKGEESNVVRGVMTLVALEIILNATVKDSVVIVPNPKFGLKLSNTLGTLISFLKVPVSKVDNTMLYVWDRSRLSIVSREYYLANKDTKFWQTQVREIRL